jgi:asparagine synthase (glutamine-hydrolysing)
MTNRDRTAWIVFNGEIYNYRELRAELAKLGHEFHTDSDTEVILAAYERYGADCPKHLRGMFAFAIYDERTEELLLARDRVGKKPLLYALTAGGIVFGSEFTALLKHPDVGRDVDREAVHHYLSFMCVPAPLTAYRSGSSSPGTRCATRAAPATCGSNATGAPTSRRSSKSRRRRRASARPNCCATRCACG